MRLTEISYAEARPIDGYGPGFFRVNDHVLRGPSLVTPWDAGPWGGLEDLATLLDLAGRIDVLLLGMGKEIAYPPRALRADLEAAGIGVEPMSSPAACRTYNMLLSEGRRISAALLPLG
ncbi:Mth938-like domain-containing protein [Pseudogemmobacter bohemicus]|uniref:Mth938-like domain-containing protein n=1 Tax=Pseudogemmobacter bohemicus TaxID=2250708 RepID=UPI000DD4CB61|nr:Mth938-like domain-containing protein [Pseudogemmobacter bohemicus]